MCICRRRNVTELHVGEMCKNQTPTCTPSLGGLGGRGRESVFTLIMLCREPANILLNSALMSSMSTSLRLTITLIRVLSSVPAPCHTERNDYDERLGKGVCVRVCLDNPLSVCKHSVKQQGYKLFTEQAFKTLEFTETCFVSCWWPAVAGKKGSCSSINRKKILPAAADTAAAVEAWKGTKEFPTVGDETNRTDVLEEQKLKTVCSDRWRHTTAL